MIFAWQGCTRVHRFGQNQVKGKESNKYNIKYNNKYVFLID